MSNDLGHADTESRLIFSKPINTTLKIILPLPGDSAYPSLPYSSAPALILYK